MESVLSQLFSDENAFVPEQPLFLRDCFVILPPPFPSRFSRGSGLAVNPFVIRLHLLFRPAETLRALEHHL